MMFNGITGRINRDHPGSEKRANWHGFQVQGVKVHQIGSLSGFLVLLSRFVIGVQGIIPARG
jgi:hypothetical protein